MRTALLLLLTFPALLACASAPKAAAPDAASAEAFMKAYTETWNRHDAAGLARDFYALGPTVEEQTAATTKTFADLVAQGYTKSDIHDIKACMTGEASAWAGMKFTRLKTDGQPLGPPVRASAYDLGWQDGRGWRIVKMGVPGASADQPLSCPE